MTGRPIREDKLLERYDRIADQLQSLFAPVPDPLARMATAAAVLDAKMSHFYWTGFYRLVDGELIVGPYQGSLACMRLERGKGVCWAAVNRGEPVLVPDVRTFEGHIACDSRSRSEVAVPLRDAAGTIVGVLDVDSERPEAFRDADVRGLERVAALMCAVG